MPILQSHFVEASPFRLGRVTHGAPCQYMAGSRTTLSASHKRTSTTAWVNAPAPSGSPSLKTGECNFQGQSLISKLSHTPGAEWDQGRVQLFKHCTENDRT